LTYYGLMKSPPFGDMSACCGLPQREGFPRANLRARGVLSYNDTGADAQQLAAVFFFVLFLLR
ncbi:MAG: hypothetical protein J5832_04960, partial [Clostridia bacterium]|nr:hypothetical protein [Clostridia bacterium]